MNRAQQREVSLILTTAKAHESTLAVTSHCDEVMMEHLQAAGLELVGDYDAATRRKMGLVGHAMSNGSFPIAHCADLLSARRDISRADPLHWNAIENFIARRSVALRCD